MRSSSARTATAPCMASGSPVSSISASRSSELDLSEVALLVAIVRGPSYYDPRRHPDRARARRDLVLKLMAERGIISAQRGAGGAASAGSASRAAAPGSLLSGVSGFRAPDPAARLSRRGSDPGRAADLHEPRAARAGCRPSRRSTASSTRLDRAHRRSNAQARRRGGRHLAAERRCDRDRRQPQCRLRRFQSSAGCAPAHWLAGEAVRLSDGAGDAVATTPRRIVQDAPVSIKLVERQALAARELHPPDLRAGAAGAGARRVVESRHRRTSAWMSGLPKSRRRCSASGSRAPPAQVPAMLLGAVDATPMEVAQMYNGLANGGFRTPLRAVRAVISAGRQADQGVSARGHAGRAAPTSSSHSIG